MLVCVQKAYNSTTHVCSSEFSVVFLVILFYHKIKLIIIYTFIDFLIDEVSLHTPFYSVDLLSGLNLLCVICLGKQE